MLSNNISDIISDDILEIILSRCPIMVKLYKHSDNIKRLYLMPQKILLINKKCFRISNKLNINKIIKVNANWNKLIKNLDFRLNKVLVLA